MKHSVKYFKKANSIQWVFPLQVGILNDINTSLNPETLHQHNFTKISSDVFYITEETKLFNILISASGLKDTLKLISKLSKIKVDAILILESDINYINKVNRENSLSALDELIQLTGASGVFILKPPKKLSRWFDDFLELLSCNFHIRSALEKCTPKVFSYLNSSLEERTKLSVYVKNLIVALHNLDDKKAKELQINLFPGQMVNREEYLDYLVMNSSEFEGPRLNFPSSNIFPQSKEVLKYLSIENFQSFDMEEDLDAYINLNFDSDQVGSSGTKLFSASMKFPDYDREIDLSQELPYSSEIDSFAQEPRYLQSKITEFQVGRSIERKITPSLLEDKIYEIQVRIGYQEDGWLKGKKRLPTEKIFEDLTDDVETLLIVFKYSMEKEPQQQTVSLPRIGSSTLANFSFTTAKAGQQFEGSLFVYHKNRMIQSAVICGKVFSEASQSNASPIEMKVMNSARCILTDLNERSDFTNSLYYDQESSLLGVSDKVVVNLDIEDGLKNTLKRIKNSIEEAVRHIDDHPEDLTNEANVHLLKKIAMHGRIIYDLFLKKKMDFTGPIQIVSQSASYIPLDFVYTFPPPAENAKLCPNAIESLEKGNCSSCQIDKNKSIAPYVCPLGFLGFSKVIERHNLLPKESTIGHHDFQLISEPFGTRKELKVLNQTVFGSTKRVDNVTSGLIDQIANKIKSISEKTRQANTWEDWEKQVETIKPDCLILLVHTELNQEFDIMQMEIGENDFKIQAHINDSLIKSKNGSEKPMVILIGCNTSDIDEAGFDFTSQFISQGAPIVLSNFTKIRGRQAGPIVIQLLDFIEQNKAKSWTLGEVLLRLRQKLLAQGIMVSLSLTAYGDADWKLKI